MPRVSWSYSMPVSRRSRWSSRPAVQGEREDLADVVARPEGQALGEEPHGPRPLVPVGAEPEEERRVLAAEPLDDLRRRPRVRPRLGVAHRDLAAVREARLEPCGALPLDDGHLVAGAHEVPRGRSADDACTQHDHSHDDPHKRKRGKAPALPLCPFREIAGVTPSAAAVVPCCTAALSRPTETNLRDRLRPRSSCRVPPMRGACRNGEKGDTRRLRRRGPDVGEDEWNRWEGKGPPRCPRPLVW